MPFGLRNAAQTFQRFIDSVFHGLSFVISYIDDVLIFSKTREDHYSHLEQVLDRLRTHGLQVHLKKCEFFQSEVDFLGHRVTPEGIKPLQKKIQIITDWPTPTDSNALRRFLGVVGFYRLFVPKFADRICPLQDLLTASLQSAGNFQWTEQHQKSFKNIKQALSERLLLHHPDPNCTAYHLYTDASADCVGAVLHQTSSTGTSPLGMFSKKLSSSQRMYSTFDRELLAAYLAVLHFRNLIEGLSVTLFTDHKPLAQAFHANRTTTSDRNQRYLTILSEYVADVQYIRGADNVIADALSRLPDFPVNDHVSNIATVAVVAAPSSQFPVDLPSIAEAQRPESFSPAPNIRSYSLDKDVVVWCETSTPYPRPIIPPSLRDAVIASFHRLGHFGYRKTAKLITERYFWPGMRKSIKTYCWNCQDCQRSKVTRHTVSPQQAFALPSNRFEAVHIDIVGPLPPANATTFGHQSARYLLTMVDRSTGWLEATPLESITAEVVAHAFVSSWVSRYGVPLYVITDRGRQFESEFFHSVSSSIGFHRLRTTAYHPQTNGKVERAHRTLKTMLRARGNDWLTDLPVALLAMHVAPDDQGISPFTRVTGELPMVPRILTSEPLAPTDIRTRLQELLTELPSPHAKTHEPRSYVPKDLEMAEFVWVRVDRVRSPLEAPYSGPYRVKQRTDKFFVIFLPSGNTESVSIDRLKPARLSLPKSAVQPAANSLPEKAAKPEEPMDSSPPRAAAESNSDAMMITFIINLVMYNVY
ncbi:hypothetical protein BOX15_Mlig008949g9 [Macrostomum lignano]|uniref:Integrase catalytic domain-containing protein n=1 Tax=Macrostomum lignano TaxID=282301 RepID=A0A267H1I7_9PLAT|nr:hypothetical protein BOX15_Mlig008949g9 [Macrostomum lignano]